MSSRNKITLLLLLACSQLHAGVEVLSRFEPPRVAVGNTARYVVEVIDSDTDAFASAEQVTALPIPPINGITFRNARTSTSQHTSIINGRAEYSVTQQITVDAIPSSTGTYAVSDYFIDYKNTRLKVPAVSLDVVERSANAAPTTNELIFIDLNPPETLYVGQKETILLKLYIASDVRLGDYRLEGNSDGFITNGGPPTEPSKSVEVVNGRRYRVFSWPLTITPISSGKQGLDFQFTLIAQLPNRQNSRNSPFGNSIFDDLFARTERLNVYSRPTQINVLPLPADNQPKSFSGAVGQFNISVNTDTDSTRANEPIMLSIKLSGQGNFDRIQAPKLPKTEGWRSYPPESIFEKDDAHQLGGMKRFDYVFIPEKAGTLELPEVRFSFFDPDIKEYVELTSPEITVEVASSNVPVASTSATPSSETGNNTSPRPNLTKSLSSEELLITLDYRPKKGRDLPTGSLFTSSFYWLNGSLFAIVSLAAVLSYRRKLVLQSPHYGLVKTAREELKTALNKTAGSDPATFFSNAQKAVRLAATIRLKSNFRAADSPTLEAHFRQTGVAETTIELTRSLFETAEAYRFSSQNQTVDLDEFRRQLKTLLKAL